MDNSVAANANYILRLLEPFESKIPTQSGQFILSYSFRCRNVSKARMLAINAYQAPTDHFFDNMSQDMVTKADEDGEDRVDGLAATFTCLTGISLGETGVPFYHFFSERPS